MRPAIRMNRFFSRSILAVCALLVVWILFRHRSTGLIEEEVMDLSLLQQKQLEMYVEMIKLLITLDTLLFGAIGAIFAHFYERRKASNIQANLAIAAAVLAGGSVVCGYLSYRRVIVMFQAHFFNLLHPRVSWTFQWQFYLFLASALVAAWFSYRALKEEDLQ